MVTVKLAPYHTETSYVAVSKEDIFREYKEDISREKICSDCPVIR